jgi:protein-S-isoprenylcysteine O-methyltransferase Ste14
VMSIVSLGFVALLAVSALDRRAHWSDVPFAVVLLGDVAIVAGFTFVCFVMRENSFSSATIELSTGQHVISTGPYAVVRHPMYLGALVYLVAIPIALASWWGLLVLLVILPGIVWRLLDEEKFLAKNLTGYSEYQALVKSRLVPFVW